MSQGKGSRNRSIGKKYRDNYDTIFGKQTEIVDKMRKSVSFTEKERRKLEEIYIAGVNNYNNNYNEIFDKNEWNNVCPKCGSKNIYEGGDYYLQCEDCKHAIGWN